LLRQAARGWGKRLFQRAGAYEVISLGFSLNGISGIPGNRWSETKENIKQHLQTMRARMMMIIREAGIEGRKLREGKCWSPDPGLTIFGHPITTLNLPRDPPKSKLAREHCGYGKMYLYPLFTLWERVVFANFFCLHYVEK